LIFGSDVKSNGVRVPEGVSRLLRDLIHERTGIFFEDTRMDLLLDKLQPLAEQRGVASFLEYYYILKDNDHGEWNRAWEALSVQETYFYREIAQIKALVDNLIPAWFQRTMQPFRIWSAACATGEEPYTIAMALAEKGFGAHPIEIYASDASPNALEKAREGIYRPKSFRSMNPSSQQKYFKPVANGWQLSPEIMKRVTFTRVNLLELGEVSPAARVNAIFCRNVFIYFSPHAIRQTVAMMAAKMPPGAHLFVGASESLLRLTTDFELKEIGDALAYVRI
jgi:chemotaxis protein methyltransferase CheR